MLGHIGTILISIVLLFGLKHAYKAKLTEDEAKDLKGQERRAKVLEARGQNFRATVLSGRLLFVLIVGIVLEALHAVMSVCDGWFASACSKSLGLI